MHTVYYSGIDHGWKITGPYAPQQVFTTKQEAESYCEDLNACWMWRY